MAFKKILTQLARAKHSNAIKKKQEQVFSATDFFTEHSYTTNHTMKWSKELIAAVLESFSSHRPIRIFIRHTHSQNFDTFNTQILGFDVNSNELLLDTPCPLNYHILAQCHDVKALVQIEILSGDGHFIIDAHIDGLFNKVGGALECIVKTKRALFTHERRRYERIIFERKNAPAIHLQTRGKPSAKLKLIDLSRQGAKCIFEGQNIQSQLHSDALLNNTNTLDVEIDFNEHFSMQLQAQIINAKYHRAPYCHNIIRLKFEKPSACEQAQIDQFIYSMKNNDMPFAA